MEVNQSQDAELQEIGFIISDAHGQENCLYFFVRSLVFLLLQKHGAISLCVVLAFVMWKGQLYLKYMTNFTWSMLCIIMLEVYLC